jgi:hypothetical protein
MQEDHMDAVYIGAIALFAGLSWALTALCARLTAGAN